MRALSIRPLLSGLAAVGLAYLGQRALRSDGFFDAAWLLGSACAIFVVAFWAPAFFPERPWRLPAAPLLPWHHPRTRMATGGLLAAVVLASVSLRIFWDEEPRTALAWWLHLFSVLLAVAAAMCADAPGGEVAQGAGPAAGKGECRLRDSGRTMLPALGALGAILAVAAFFRLYHFDSLPFGTWYDEAEHGIQALRILDSPGFYPIFEGAINGPAHYLYLVAGAFRLFDASTQSIRIVNVCFGLAMVPAAYLVGRELFGHSTGLALALLMAVSSWAVTLSRFGMYATNSTPLFALLAAGFLLRGLRRGHMTDFAVAGLWLGLGLCFYTSFRLFVPALAVFLLHNVWVQWWRTRNLPRPRFWLGVALALLVAALVVAPVALYACKHPEIFWARVEHTFIFAKTDEASRWPALFESVRRHLLMFNWHGDSNGRHNLPGAPMLDDLAAVLLVVGMAYSLRRASDPRYAFLLGWLAFGLMGGILSLDFEAPQSLRANGTLAAAGVLAVVPLAVLGFAWNAGVGRYFPRAGWVPLLLFAILVTGANFQRYFLQQANDFSVWNAYSTPETLTAQLLNDLDPEVDAYVTSYFHNHPTLRFLAREARPFGRLETSDQFPLAVPANRGALLVLNSDGHAQYEQARRYYPHATFETVYPPMAGPAVLYTVRLTPQDIASVQGLDARYYSNANFEGRPALARKDTVLDFDWATSPPLPLPFSVEWEGILHADAYGPHDLFLESPAQAELFVGEQEVFSGTGVLSGTLRLAQGNHFLRLRAAGDRGRFKLSWRPPAGPAQVVPAGALYVPSVSANGLLGEYFANGDWQAPLAFSRIDPRLALYIHVTPLSRPYTVEWTGKIAIPQAGAYYFGLESIDESALWIDGAHVVGARTPNLYVESAIELDEGLHDIRVRFADRTDHTHLSLYWVPPGGTRQVVPSQVLFPPQGSYGRVKIPELATVVATGGAGGHSPLAPALPAPALAGTAEIVAAGLQRPRGVAVDRAGTVYVAEGEGQQVTVLAPDGILMGFLPGDAATLVEPADVAVDDVSQRVVVLDAGTAQIQTFTAEGERLEAAVANPADFPSVERSRGLFVGADGAIWIANTPGGRIVVLEPDGALRGGFPVWPGEDAQPADVAVGKDRRIFVVDAARNRLVRYSADGQRERAWALPPATTLDGPHLAVDAQGVLYLTEPESGRVIKLDATGEAIGAWDLPARLGRPVKPVGIAVGPDGRIWVADSIGGNLIVITPG